MSILSMAKLLVKSVFHGPYTDRYPKKSRENYERTRGSIDNDIDQCIFCGMCMRRCPTSAITVTKKPEKKWSIERMQCIQCGYCVSVCPKKCLSMRNQYTTPDTHKVRDEYTDARVSDH